MKLGFKYGMDAGGELSWEIWGGGDQGSSLGFEIHPLMRVGWGDPRDLRDPRNPISPKKRRPSTESPFSGFPRSPLGAASSDKDPKGRRESQAGIPSTLESVEIPSILLKTAAMLQPRHSRALRSSWSCFPAFPGLGQKVWGRRGAPGICGMRGKSPFS